MKLLITGAANFQSEQLKMLEEAGFSLFFQKDERGQAQCDFSEIEAVICNGLFLYRSLDEFPKLKFVQLTSAGLDRVPVDEMKKRGITLFNARGVYSVPMAEFALAGVLSVYKHLNAFSKNQNNRIWQKDRTLRELCGETVAIVGCGSVGTECAKRFSAFGTEIIGVDAVEPKDSVYSGFYPVERITDALEKADITVLTLPLTDKTKSMFNAGLFGKMKTGSVLVNIARGPIVSQNDLITALKSGKLSGAVLDVFENEPLEADSELWNCENVIITPHNSFVSEKNSERLFSLAYTNLKNCERVI